MDYPNIPIPHQANLPQHPLFRQLWSVNDPMGRNVVSWELYPVFTDPRPHNYTLQVAKTSTPTESDWVDVGPAAENTCYLVDDERRDYGETFDHHRRVVLETPVNVYKSPIVPVGIVTSHRDWRLKREFLRQERRKGKLFTGTAGFLMKRRRYGNPCTRCAKNSMAMASDPTCHVCEGTGVQVGYHRMGLEEIYADMGLAEMREDIEEARQTVKDVVVRTTLAGFPLISSRDIWIEKVSGQRWSIEKVLATAAIRNDTFKVDVEMRLIPFTDHVYKVNYKEGL